MVLNGFSNPVTQVYDCYNSPANLTATLCTDPPRKLVEVTSTVQIPTAFMAVIGINSVPVSATAISEAASVDVVLVIDRSELMTFGPDYLHPYGQTDPMRDPFYCNSQPGTGDYSGDIGSCQPFDQVINAAAAFTNILIPNYDYASVVTFDKEPHVVLSLLSGNNPSTVASTLKNLTVYQGDESVSGGSANAIFPNGSPSRVVTVR